MCKHELDLRKNSKLFDFDKSNKFLFQALLYYFNNIQTILNWLSSIFLYSFVIAISVIFTNLVEAQTIEISIDAPNYVIEGEDIEITLRLNQSIAQNSSITVELSIVEDNPVYGYLHNYSPNPIIITESDNLTKLVSIETNQNVVTRTDGEIIIQMESGIGYEPASNERTVVNILDQELLPELSISSSATSVTEGETFEISVTLDPKPLTGQIQIMLKAEDIGVGKGYFNSFNINPVNIGTSGTNANPIIVSTNADDFDQHYGMIRISVVKNSKLIRPSFFSNSSTSVIIFDDDAPPIISITNQLISIEEGNINANLVATLEVTLSTESYFEIDVYFATTTNGTALGTSNNAIGQGDFVIKSGKLTFAAKNNSTAGVTSQQISITIIGDEIDEEEEFIEILLTNANNAALPTKNAKSIIKIIDNDDEPILSINSLAKNEGNIGETDLNFTLSLSSASGKIISFDYETISDSATAGEDFIAVDLTQFTIPPRTTSVPLSIKLRGDTVPEADETFLVRLTNAKNATILDYENIGYGTIISDDNSAFGITNSSGNEDDGVVKFLVTLTPVSNKTTKVLFYTPENSTDSAKLAKDFYTLYKELTFNPSDRIKQVEVPLIYDELDESDEEFTVKLANPTGGTVLAIGRETAKGIIIDNDSTARISIQDVEISEGDEGNSTLLFPVTVNSISGQVIKVKYYTPIVNSVDGVASSSDFIPIIENELEIEEGMESGFIPITIIGDDAFELDEQFTVILYEPTNAEISRIVGRGIILNDDKAIPRIESITVQKSSYVEGEKIEFEVTASIPAEMTNSVKVPIYLSQVGDFLIWHNPKYLTLIPNSPPEVLLTFSVLTHDDLLDEPNGSVTATMKKVNDVLTVNRSKSSITVNILDNDDENIEQPRISVASSVVNEILTGILPLSSTQQSSDTINNTKPTVIVSTNSTNIEEGALVEFDLVSLGNINRALIVKFKISQIGNFIRSELPSRTKLTQNQRSVRIGIETIDDKIAEQDGKVTLTLIPDTTYLLNEQDHATVFISDQADRLTRKSEIIVASKEILPELMRSIGVSSNEITSNRAQSAFLKSDSTINFEYDGNKKFTNFLTASGNALNTESKPIRSILNNSSFVIKLHPEENLASPATIWGTSNIRDLASNKKSGTNSWTGEFLSSQVGIDTNLGQSRLLGISTSKLNSEIDYTFTSEKRFLFNSNFKSMNPYFAWTSIDQDTQLKGMIGYGLGKIKIKQNNYKTESLDSRFYTFGFGGYHLFHPFDSISKSGVFELGIKSDSWVINQYLMDPISKLDILNSHASSHWISAVSSYEVSSESGNKFIPFASIGFQSNQEDQNRLLQLNFGSGFNYTSLNGFSIIGSSNALLAKHLKQNNWSVFNKLTLNIKGHKLNTVMDISSTINQFNDLNSISLRKNKTIDQLNKIEYITEDSEVKKKLGLEIEIQSESSSITPFSKIEFLNFKSAFFKLGARVQLIPHLNLEIAGTQSSDFIEDVNKKFDLRGQISW